MLFTQDDLQLLAEYDRMMKLLEQGREFRKNEIIEARLNKLGRFADAFVLHRTEKTRQKLIEVIESMGLRLAKDKDRKTKPELSPLAKEQHYLIKLATTLNKEVSLAIGKLIEYRSRKPDKLAKSEKLWSALNEWSKQLAVINLLIAKGVQQNESKIRSSLQDLLKSMHEQLEKDKKPIGLSLFKSELIGIATHLFKLVDSSEKIFAEKIAPSVASKKNS